MSTISASTTSTTAYKVTADTTGTLVLQTGSTPTTAVTIDTSQNMGLGVTPSAWSGFTALQVGNAALWTTSTNNTHISSNLYYNGSARIYIGSNYATEYAQQNGEHKWFNAASGTAGGTVSVTQAMTLDASGKLGIGSTSPTYALDILNSSSPQIRQTRAIVIDAPRTLGALIGSGYSTGTTIVESAQIAFVSDTSWSSTSAPTYMSFSTTASGSTTATERARIDSSGNLLVGTSSAFAANGHNFQNANSAAFVMALRNANATAGRYWSQGPDNNNAYILYNQSNTGVYITNGGTSWSANSDERLKTELTPFANAAQKVCSLRAGTGRYLTDEETVSRSFLIAQDVQAILPEAVDVQPDEQGTLGLRYTDLIPLLTAAIQEQQALIETLTNRITVLENK